jgi:hypothetical protein
MEVGPFAVAAVVSGAQVFCEAVAEDPHTASSPSDEQ